MIEAARRRAIPGIVGIVITGYGTVKDAVDAIKRGASDFIAKPFQFDELMHVLEKALEQRRLTSENAYLRSQLEERYQFGGILGRSRPMQALFQMLETVARSNSTILITGETGTGKEVVARAIHHNSPRRAHRFVALNCSAIPETLLEAELFGHVRGAFTGAVGARQGRFEQAHKGTLFLDEVGTMSVALQMKLLRALQEREFERVGDNQTIKVDVRVIAATNSELSRAWWRTGAFREDLYYRLNVIPIELPPLRDRRDDIPMLVKHFLDKFAPGRTMHVSQGAMRALMAYPWPGNVRQLENAVERAVALERRPAGDRRRRPAARDPGRRRRRSRRRSSTSRTTGSTCRPTCASIERDLIQRALERTRGNRNKAADLLRHQADDARGKAEADWSRSLMPPRFVVLDDHRRRAADGVPRRRARRAAADVQAHPGKASGRGDEVLRARPAVGVGRRGEAGGRRPGVRRAPREDAARPRLAARGRASRPAAEVQGRQEEAQPGLAQGAVRASPVVVGRDRRARSRMVIRFAVQPEDRRAAIANRRTAVEPRPARIATRRRPPEPRPTSQADARPPVKAARHRVPRRPWRAKGRRAMVLRASDKFDGPRDRKPGGPPARPLNLEGPAPHDRQARRSTARLQTGRPAARSAAPRMIAHVVLFKPRADLSPEARRRLAESFEAALRQIPSIRRARVGKRDSRTDAGTKR